MRAVIENFQWEKRLGFFSEPAKQNPNRPDREKCIVIFSK